MKAIWTIRPSPEDINKGMSGRLADLLGIEVVAVADDSMVCSMPVTPRHHQPYGILHGGASCVLAETVGSLASAWCVDREAFQVVGMEINANHIRSVAEGMLYATAKAVHIGRKTHVWDIRIHSDVGKLICISRFTVAVIPLAYPSGSKSD